MDQLLDLLAGQLAAAGQLAEDPLAVGAGLVDHLPALLLGHLQLGLGVGRGVLAAAGRLDLGFLAAALGLVGGLAHQPGGLLLGAAADLVGGLAGGLEDAGGLLAEHLGDHLVVQHDGGMGGAALGRAQLALEELLPFLQAGQLGREHPQEVAYLALIEAAPRHRERGRGHRVR